MRKTFIGPADVTEAALFARGWYEGFWYKERPTTKAGTPIGIAHRTRSAGALLMAVGSDGLATRMRQLRTLFRRRTGSDRRSETWLSRDAAPEFVRGHND